MIKVMIDEKSLIWQVSLSISISMPVGVYLVVIKGRVKRLSLGNVTLICLP